MTAYHLTSDAQSDLIEIRRYTLKQWGSAQSQKYLFDLAKTLVLLSENSLIGVQRPDVANGIFSFPYVSHVIYYRLDNNQIIVFAILHKGMIPNNHLENR